MVSKSVAQTILQVFHETQYMISFLFLSIAPQQSHIVSNQSKRVITHNKMQGAIARWIETPRNLNHEIFSM